MDPFSLWKRAAVTAYSCGRGFQGEPARQVLPDLERDGYVTQM